MTSLHQMRPQFKVSVEKAGHERREHRRHDLEQQGIAVERFDGSRKAGATFGQLVDLSAGGARIRVKGASVKPDSQIRVRLSLPEYAGISPFISSADGQASPKKEWVGWMAVARVFPVAGSKDVDVAGRLVDMEDMDRGMLKLYLSTQPLAA
jgi:hypothetical protein